MLNLSTHCRPRALVCCALLLAACRAPAPEKRVTMPPPPRVEDIQVPVATATPTPAQDPKQLRITDRQGHVTLLDLAVEPASIDYTEYGLVYQPDHQHGGVRIRQGEGVLTVNWEALDRLSLTGNAAEILTHAGERMTATLVPWSKDGLSGRTSLGRFSIAQSKVKSIEVVH